ncbi:LysM peptidoglycan-binding domain-containing protein [Novispirillum itersonii subsp. nipponicum]
MADQEKSDVKRPVVAVVLGIAVLAAAGVAALLTLEGDKPPQDPPAPASAPSAASAPAKPAAPPAQKEPAKPKAAAVGPGFDVVRIDPDGNTVIAGRAVPGTDVVILDAGKEIGHAKADERGEWVFLPDRALPPGSRELSLRGVDEKGGPVDSRDVVVLVVPEQKGGKTLAVRTDRETGTSTILQGTSPIPAGSVIVLDSVDYDETGALSLRGRTTVPGTVQVYLDNAPVGSVKTADGNTWSLKPEPKAAKGDHTLRADLLDEKGKVVGRIELPFSRIEIAGMPNGLRVVVQEGNSLWRMARRAYGDGLAYTVIYDANKGQIRDPNLIYPGQVFVVPRQ